MENTTTRPQIVKFKRGVNLIPGQYRYKKDGKYKEKQQVEHNHMPDENATAGIILKATLCDQAKQQEAVPLPEVYRNIMSEQNLDEDIMPPSYNSVRSLMHRARRQDLFFVYNTFILCILLLLCISYSYANK